MPTCPTCQNAIVTPATASSSELVFCPYCHVELPRTSGRRWIIGLAIGAVTSLVAIVLMVAFVLSGMQPKRATPAVAPTRNNKLLAAEAGIQLPEPHAQQPPLTYRWNPEETYAYKLTSNCETPHGPQATEVTISLCHESGATWRQETCDINDWDCVTVGVPIDNYGLLLTSATAIEDSLEIDAGRGKAKHKCYIQHIERDRDLAFVSMRARHAAPPFADFSAMSPGSQIVAYGFPSDGITTPLHESSAKLGTTVYLHKLPPLTPIITQLSEVPNGFIVLNERDELVGLASRKWCRGDASPSHLVSIDEIRRLIARHDKLRPSASAIEAARQADAAETKKVDSTMPAPAAAPEVPPPQFVRLRMRKGFGGVGRTAQRTLAFEATTRRLDNDSQPAYSTNERTSSGLLLVDQKGDVGGVESGETLPYFLRSAPELLLERWPRDSSQQWSFNTRIPIVLSGDELQELSKWRFANYAESQALRSSTATFPVIYVRERVQYRIISAYDQEWTLAKEYELATDYAGTTGVKLAVNGKATLVVDRSTGLVKNYHFDGRMQAKQGTATQTIPLKLTFELTSPLPSSKRQATSK